MATKKKPVEYRIVVIEDSIETVENQLKAFADLGWDIIITNVERTWNGIIVSGYATRS